MTEATEKEVIIIKTPPGPFVKRILLEQDGKRIDTGYKLRRTKNNGYRTES